MYIVLHNKGSFYWLVTNYNEYYLCLSKNIAENKRDYLNLVEGQLC